MMDEMDVRDIIRSFRNLCLSLHRKYEIGGQKALTRTSNSPNRELSNLTTNAKIRRFGVESISRWLARPGFEKDSTPYLVPVN